MKYEEEETKDQTMVLLIINTIIAIILGIAIILIWCVDHVYASTWVSIYDKSNLNNELAYTGNLSQPLYVCNPATNIRCVTYGTRGTNVINWNSVGYNIKQELTYDSGDDVTFSVSFRISQTGTSINCNNWGMGATAHINNRLGTQQTINNRSWERLTCQANVTNNGTQYVATYKFTGSFQASASGTSVSFMFPSNTDSSSLAEIMYEVIDITLNAQTDNTNEIINNNTQNSQNIINNQNQNTQDIINNQNENNQQLIDTINNQNLTCHNFTFGINDNIAIEDKYLSFNNELIISDAWNVSNYTRINTNKVYIISSQFDHYAPAFCLYDNNKNKISCETYNNRNLIEVNTGNAYYIRYSIPHNTQTNFQFTGEYCYDYREKEQEQMDEFLNYDHNFGNQSDTSYADTTHQNEETMTQNLDGNLTNVSINIDSDANGIIWQIIENTIHQNTIVFVMVVTILSLGIVKLVLGR